jgi:hypothetical protein
MNNLGSLFWRLPATLNSISFVLERQGNWFFSGKLHLNIFYDPFLVPCPEIRARMHASDACKRSGTGLLARTTVMMRFNGAHLKAGRGHFVSDNRIIRDLKWLMQVNDSQCPNMSPVEIEQCHFLRYFSFDAIVLWLFLLFTNINVIVIS